MSHRNNQQLNQIKMKYGYSSKTSMNSTSNVKEFISQMVSKPVDDPFQRVQLKTNKANVATKFDNVYKEKELRSVQQDYHRFRSNSTKPNQGSRLEDSSKKPNFDYLFAQNYDKNKQTSSLFDKYKSMKPSVPEPKNEFKNEIVESYEKTYDLLKNYRQKIKSSFEAKLQPSKERDQRLNIRENKENKENHKSKNERDQIFAQSKIYFEGESFKPNKNKVAQSKFTIQQLRGERPPLEPSRASSKVTEPRKSPLQTLDPNIFDVSKKLDNIDKLQNKIKTLLGDKCQS